MEDEEPLLTRRSVQVVRFQIPALPRADAGVAPPGEANGGGIRGFLLGEGETRPPLRDGGAPRRGGFLPSPRDRLATASPLGFRSPRDRLETAPQRSPRSFSHWLSPELSSGGDDFSQRSRSPQTRSPPRAAATDVLHRFRRRSSSPREGATEPLGVPFRKVRTHDVRRRQKDQFPDKGTPRMDKKKEGKYFQDRARTEGPRRACRNGVRDSSSESGTPRQPKGAMTKGLANWKLVRDHFGFSEERPLRPRKRVESLEFEDDDYWGNFKRNLFDLRELLEDPGATENGIYIQVFLISLIILSTAFAIFETVDELVETYGWLFEAGECIFTLIFTLELLVRILDLQLLGRTWTCCCKMKLNCFNVIDLVSILPVYGIWVSRFVASHLLAKKHTTSMKHPKVLSSIREVRVIRMLRMVRVLRIAKAARHSEEIAIIIYSIWQSLEGLFVMISFSMMSCVFVATVLYWIEADVADTPFTSIPAACWWSVVTVSTVGYGDVVPSTVVGKVWGGVTMIVGIIILAACVAAVQTSFMETYQERLIEMRVRKSLKERRRRMKLEMQVVRAFRRNSAEIYPPDQVSERVQETLKSIRRQMDDWAARAERTVDRIGLESAERSTNFEAHSSNESLGSVSSSAANATTPPPAVRAPASPRTKARTYAQLALHGLKEGKDQWLAQAERILKDVIVAEETLQLQKSTETLAAYTSGIDPKEFKERRRGAMHDVGAIVVRKKRASTVPDFVQVIRPRPDDAQVASPWVTATPDGLLLSPKAEQTRIKLTTAKSAFL